MYTGLEHIALPDSGGEIERIREVVSHLYTETAHENQPSFCPVEDELNLTDIYTSFREILSPVSTGGQGRPFTSDFGIGIPETDILRRISMEDHDTLNVQAIRKDFPILGQKINGHDLIWFDNGATTQKPRQVIDAISRFYETDYSNIHRGAHTLAARATDAYEGAREKVQHFINASSPEEIVFVRGTTEGVNLIAQTFGRKFLEPGDEVCTPKQKIKRSTM